MRKLEAGEAARAAELFTRPDWRAAADYEAGNYEGALAALEQQTGTEAAYNRGNALLLQGAYDPELNARIEAMLSQAMADCGG